MTKTEARKLAKACRAAVDLHTVGHTMAGVLFALPAWQHADTVLAFASIPDEPDTADILRQALAALDEMQVQVINLEASHKRSGVHYELFVRLPPGLAQERLGAQLAALEEVTYVDI